MSRYHGTVSCVRPLSEMKRNQPLGRNAILPGFLGRRAGLCFVLAVEFNLSPAFAVEPAGTETIVLIRHGEKPDLGLGQLNCQGLNRALALPAVIGRQFGRPDAIFAPDPSEAKSDQGQPYNYVRPLATIEPTAITYGLPIDASIGVSNIGGLRRKLDDPAYRNSIVLVGWEHNEIVDLARLLMADHGGDPAIVPGWNTTDFDSIYVVKITRTSGGSTVEFEHRHEGLNGLPTACPGQKPD
jgi:hypothetical protein